ncbi:MAG: RNA-binding transcriptional accessory protein, partial [Clostridium sp.]|nr:RNA-binding transcriptional accessory protein [Clostridium sp.]
MDIAQVITSELGIQPRQTEAVIRLIDEGNTIPFIARYRKEMTGAMNDELLRRFDERLRSLRALEERRQTVLSTIEAQGQLTAELRARVEGAMTAVELEDIYRPYRPKRRTRAMIAKEKGLQGLADYIMSDGNISPEKEAEKYIDPEKEVPDAETALALAKDIIAEMVSDNADFRTFIRNLTMNEGMLVTAKKAVRGETFGKKAGARGGDDAEGENAGSAKAAAAASAKTAKSAEVLNKKLADREQVYENYFEYEEALKRIPGHRILAINRGETEKFLTVKIAAPEEKILECLYAAFGCGKNPVMETLRREACEDAYRRLIAPSIETEIRNSLTEKAEDRALEVFDSNLEQLLMQPPVAGKTVLGWDPAFRTGCKLAVVERTGQVLDTAVIYPTAPQNKVAEAERVLDRLIDRYHVDVISVGNGTASRESEQIIASYLKKSRKPV